MSSLLPLAQQKEQNLSDDAGQGQWEDKDDVDKEDFERYMDEKQIITMDEQSALAMDKSIIAGLEEEGSSYPQSQDFDFPDGTNFVERPSSLQDLLQAETERIFEFSNSPDSKQFLFIKSRDDILDGEHPIDATQGHDGILEAPNLLTYWQPLRDRQLDMTEDEQERGSSADSERQEIYDETGSGEEGYSDLPYDWHYESTFRLSPEAIQDTQDLYKEYRKTLVFALNGGEELWEPSSTIPGQSKAHADVSNVFDVGSETYPNQYIIPAESFHGLDEGSGNTSTGGFGSISQLGKTMAFPKSLLVEVGKEIVALSPLTDSSMWNPNESLQNKLSMEEVHDKPGIDAETFPEFSYADSIEESIAAIPKMSTRRASLSHTQMSPNKSFRKPEKKAQDLPLSPVPQQMETHYLHQVQKLKRAVRAVLPSKHTRQSRSLSPKMNIAQSKSLKTTLHRPLPSTDSLKYGRGQLNYPLPDFSKVGPRVKFPKDDQSYRPPRGRNRSVKSSGSEAPLVFKSPAEIVREVLLSSGEGSPHKLATSDARIPEEFKSPKQATELVHQLQEDYNKLLTKYAEAENTIDLLRLGAKVNLYADPPKPSQSLQMGTVSQGSKVMAFTIPQSKTAQFSQALNQIPQTNVDSGSHVALKDHGSSIPSNSFAEGFPSAKGQDIAGGRSPGDCLTSYLAKQLETFQAQVESFESLIKMKKLSPLDQIKGFQQLTEAQDSMERAYLQAREESQQLQQHPDTAGPLGEFDPDRLMEGEIFHLGMQLEELKESIDLAGQSHFSPRLLPAPAPTQTPLVTAVSDSLAWSPTPLPLTPIPVLRTPYPENALLRESTHQGQVEVEVSSASSEGEDGGGLPEPLQHKQLRVEKEFDNLLEQYNNFKTLPDAMDLGTDQEDGGKQEVEDFSGDAHSMKSWRRPSLKEEKCQTAPRPQPMERKPSPLRDSQETVLNSRHPPSPKAKEVLSQSSTSNAANRKSSFRSPQGRVSQQSSLASSTVSQHHPHKAFPQAKTLHPEERIVSPETDSGFVGSESSRVSPLTQSPEHRTPPTRIPNAADRSVMVSANSPRHLSMRLDVQSRGSANEPVKTSVVVRSAHPRGSTQRHIVTQDASPLGNSFQTSSPSRWTNSVTGSEMGHNTESNSEEEERSTTSVYEPLPGSRRSLSASWTSSPPPQRRLNVQADVLCSRKARDQAIQALQSEVKRLRRRLEESLYRPKSELPEPSVIMGQAEGDSLSPGQSVLFGSNL
uniref:Microtubule organization protein AKNA isoform X2 n=1 Tax=Geotrypetes seraphini TaxID=260995 RepID=A0A6P8SCR2_GEOSA|nr:microtubule organization protein AKNA isoform X2 [Geotrypetes seraphini]